MGDHEMDPAFTTYSKRAYYVTHDVTSLIQTGRNALGVRLGRGYYADKNVAIESDNHNWTTAPWASEPKLKLVLAITYRDGSRETVAVGHELDYIGRPDDERGPRQRDL